jgi:hypothetical protein
VRIFVFFEFLVEFFALEFGSVESKGSAYSVSGAAITASAWEGEAPYGKGPNLFCNSDERARHCRAEWLFLQSP